MYFGRGRHSDGSFIRIVFQRRLVNLNANEANKDLICVWISRDPYSDKSILDYSMDQSVKLFLKFIVYRHELSTIKNNLFTITKKIAIRYLNYPSK